MLSHMRDMGIPYKYMHIGQPVHVWDKYAYWAEHMYVGNTI